MHTKRTKVWISAMTLCLLGVVTAEARTYQSYEGEKRPDPEIMRVRLPEDVVLLEVDGEDTAEGRFLAPRNYTSVELLPGVHTLTVRYLQLWDYDSRDDFEKFRSDAVMVELPSTSPGIYQLIHPGARNMKQAAALAASFAPTVKTVRTYSAQPVVQPAAPVVEMPQPSVAAAMPIPENAPPAPAPVPPVENPSHGPPAFSALELMKYSWQQASPAERKAFRQWLDQQ